MTLSSVKLVTRPNSAKQTLRTGLNYLNANKSALRATILFLIALMGFGQRLFSIVRYESIIHEFDPWFNYRQLCI